MQYRLITGLLAILNIGTVTAEPLNSVSPQEASTRFTQKEAIIIDVREDNEWQDKHIPGALHIPLNQLNERLAELKPYQHSPVITQCRSGKRSAKAASILQSAGFDKVYNLEGGLTAWEKEGLAIE